LAAWVSWFLALSALTFLLFTWRERLSAAHIALAYLVLTQLASAVAGRYMGLTLAVLAFLCFNFFFLPPYGTFALHDPLDWVVLFAFLGSSTLTAELLHRFRREAAIARAQADEVKRLAGEARQADALREANRAKDALLASVSHDLRTPLTSIKALAHESAELGDERALRIEEEADRLTQLVTDVLDLSRLRARALPLNPQTNEAEDLVGAALQRVSGLRGGARIITSFDPAHPLLFGHFDFSATLRALANLLENALKYSNDTDVVTLRAYRDGAWLCFEVADLAPTIAPDDAERMFDPFVRGHRGSPDTVGSGLGLTIARGVAEAQGGQVTWTARSGGGNVFTLSVPAVDPAGETEA
jgi:two-component system sensor histidine kinase KdpD